MVPTYKSRTKTNLHLHSQLVRSVVELNLSIDEGSGAEVGGSYYGVQTKEKVFVYGAHRNIALLL